MDKPSNMDTELNGTLESTHANREGEIPISGLEVVLFNHPLTDSDGFQEVVSRKKRLKRKGEDGLRSPPRHSSESANSHIEPRRGLVPPAPQ